MASKPGAGFQDEIRASIPKAAGSRVPWSHKPPDVPQFGLRCRNCHQGFLKRRCTVCQAEDNFDPRFTPKHPFDLIVSIPCKGTEEMRSSVVPQIVFAFELKRTQGKIPKRGAAELHGLLGFKEVKDHQVSGLQKVAASGSVAGVLWLVELHDGPCDALVETHACNFIPIARWVAYKESAHGASMSLAAARIQGIEITQDIGRGTKKRYWKMAELFLHYGAAVEATPKRKKKRPKKDQSPKLFDDLPAPDEEIPF